MRTSKKTDKLLEQIVVERKISMLRPSFDKWLYQILVDYRKLYRGRK